MKKKAIIAMFIVLFLCLGAYQETRQADWAPLRTAVTADDPVLDGTSEGLTFAFAAMPDTAFECPDRWNNGQVYFYGVGADTKYFDYKLYAYKLDGPAILICAGRVTLGPAVTGTANTFYADTITTSTEVWPTDVVISNSGANGVCTLTFDLLGYKHVYCEIDVTAEQVTAASAVMTGF